MLNLITRLFSLGYKNPSFVLVLILLVYSFITNYQADKKNDTIIALQHQNNAYIQRLEQEQQEAKAMRLRIYEMQQELAKLNALKNDLTNRYQNKLILLSDELNKAQCSSLSLPVNLIKWLSDTNDSPATASK